MEKIDIELAVLVLSARDFKDRRNVIRETWGNGHSNVFFIVGKHCPYKPAQRKPWVCEPKNANAIIDKHYNTQQESLTVQLSKEPNVIVVDMIDVYRHLATKLHLGYRWVIENTSAKYVLKMDDDSFARVDSVQHWLMNRVNPPKYEIIAGRFGVGVGVVRGGKWAEKKYKPNKYPPWPTGSGHIVSRPVIEYLHQNTDTWVSYQGEDTSLGIWMEKVRPQMDVHRTSSGHFITHSGDCHNKNKFVIGHKISIKKMRECYTTLDEYETIKHEIAPVCTNTPHGKKWDTFKSAINILNKVNANYTISHGTVLFWYRNCNLADSDFDIAVDFQWFMSHSAKLQKALVDGKWKYWRSFGKAGNIGYEESWKKDNIKMDIFTQAYVDGRYVSGLTVNGKTYPCDSFLQRYGKHTWNGITFNVPEPIEPYLTARYGKWKSKNSWNWATSPFLKNNGQNCCSNTEMPIIAEGTKSLTNVGIEHSKCTVPVFWCGNYLSVNYFAKIMFPECNVQKLVNAQTSGIVFTGLYSNCKLSSNFIGKMVYINGEAKIPSKPIGGYYLGPGINGKHILEVPYVSIASYYIGDAALNALKKRPRNTGERFLVYVSTRCREMRENAFDLFSKLGDVYAASRCHGSNAVYQQDNQKVDKSWKYAYKIMKKYRFALTFENANVSYYHTEKIINAFAAGSVPIYWGSDTIFNIFNKDAFIFFDKDNHQKTLEMVKYLEKNPLEYEKMVTQPILAKGALEKYFSLSDDIGGGILKRKIRKMLQGTSEIGLQRGNGKYNLDYPHGMKQPLSWSQYGQDRYIDSFFNKKRDGFFVEIGGYDGEKFSNTLYLEKERGWDGLLVEANPYTYNILKGRDRKCWFVNACVSDTVDSMTFIISGSTTSAKETMTPSFHKRISSDIKSYGKSGDKRWAHSGDEVTTKCRSLSLLMSKIGKSHIDYFSLDVEGAEMFILESIPFEEITINIFSIETDQHSAEINKFLKSKGFQEFHKLRGDTLFVNSNYLSGEQNTVTIDKSAKNIQLQTTIVPQPTDSSDITVLDKDNNLLYAFYAEAFGILDKVCKKHNVTWYGWGGGSLQLQRTNTQHYIMDNVMYWVDGDFDLNIIADDIEKIRNVWKDLPKYSTENVYTPINNCEGVRGCGSVMRATKKMKEKLKKWCTTLNLPSRGIGTLDICPPLHNGVPNVAVWGPGIITQRGIHMTNSALPKDYYVNVWPLKEAYFYDTKILVPPIDAFINFIEPGTKHEHEYGTTREDVRWPTTLFSKEMIIKMKKYAENIKGVHF